MIRVFSINVMLSLFAMVSLAQTPASTTADHPGNHGMFIVGEDNLFVMHMPMFTNGMHMYQMALRVSLPAEQTSRYQALRQANPQKAFNLINIGNNRFTLPEVKSRSVTQFAATIFDGYSNEGGGTPGAVLWDNVPVTIEDVVVFRHFNFSIEGPENLNYVIFGSGDEAFMIHYMARDPSFQHIMALGAVPDWLSADQLLGGVTVELQGMPSGQLGCASPLLADTYLVNFEGRSDLSETLDLTGALTIWYSTGNLLNASDPCSQ